MYLYFSRLSEEKLKVVTIPVRVITQQIGSILDRGIDIDSIVEKERCKPLIQNIVCATGQRAFIFKYNSPPQGFFFSQNLSIFSFTTISLYMPLYCTKNNVYLLQKWCVQLIEVCSLVDKNTNASQCRQLSLSPYNYIVELKNCEQICYNSCS